MMMNEWIRSALDLVLIGMIAFGLVQVMRLIKHLSGLRQGRLEMEKFVHDFNVAVLRAENGIKSLRQAARESGDDLEKLVEKAGLVTDELRFIVESGDKLAERLSTAAASVMRPEGKPSAIRNSQNASVPPIPAWPEDATASKKGDVADAPRDTPTSAPGASHTPQPSSRAEKELLQALQKLK